MFSSFLKTNCLKGFLPSCIHFLIKYVLLSTEISVRLNLLHGSLLHAYNDFHTKKNCSSCKPLPSCCWLVFLQHCVYSTVLSFNINCQHSYWAGYVIWRKWCHNLQKGRAFSWESGFMQSLFATATLEVICSLLYWKQYVEQQLQVSLIKEGISPWKKT